MPVTDDGTLTGGGPPQTNAVPTAACQPKRGQAALLDRLNSVVPEPKAAAPPLIVTMNEIPG